MNVIVWFGFIGSWLLFAGPVYQAALELREETFDPQEEGLLRTRLEALGEPPRISPWWWLLPPVAFVLNRRRTAAWRLAVLNEIPSGQWERFASFQNKAASWLLVAVGAMCIAVFHTGELVEGNEWPTWAFIPLLGIPFLVSVGYTANRLARDQRLRALLPTDAS